MPRRRLANNQVAASSMEPTFITYLMNPNTSHDCYFVVKSATSVKHERVGVVKRMLMAHSEVLRAELEESKLAEKTDVPVDDIFVDTLHNLLKFVYGCNIAPTLNFDDADNLLYAAEKYMMGTLKNQLALRLMTLLDYDNICSLLNNPACFRHLELSRAITRILQCETEKVLESRHLSVMCSDAFLKVLEQDTTSVEEIELWRAALKWAREKAGTEDGQVLREHLSGHLHHIRLCTLHPLDFSLEVIPTGVLKYSEVQVISPYLAAKEKLQCTPPDCDIASLTDVCLNTKHRGEMIYGRSEILVEQFLNSMAYAQKQISFTIETFQHGIELLPFKFKANSFPRPTGESLTYQCDCTVEISEIQKSFTKAPIVVDFSKQVKYDEEFGVPLMHMGRNVQLYWNTVYRVQVSFSKFHKMASGMCPLHKCKDFKVYFDFDSKVLDEFISPIQKLEYRRIIKNKV